MKHSPWLLLPMLVLSACSESPRVDTQTSGSQPRSANAAAAAIAKDKIGEAAARALSNPARPVDIVADDSVLLRIVTKDPTLTGADIERMYAVANSSQYVKDFEVLFRPITATVSSGRRDSETMRAARARRPREPCRRP